MSAVFREALATVVRGHVDNFKYLGTQVFGVPWHSSELE